MKKLLLGSLLMFMLLLAKSSWCVPSLTETQDIYPFNNSEQQQQFQQLLTKLRCLVCQNQNLADSNAGLAVDLRHIIYGLVKQQHDDNYIIDYLTERYGDFILFEPPVKPMTYLLWFGPFLILVIAMSILLMVIYKRQLSE